MTKVKLLTDGDYGFGGKYIGQVFEATVCPGKHPLYTIELKDECEDGNNKWPFFANEVEVVDESNSNDNGTE